MPTRVIAGIGALRGLPQHIAELGCRRPVVFSDPVIARTPFFQCAIEDLRASRLDHDIVDDCGIDARLTHIDRVTGKVLANGNDCVVAIGGGSVMCTGKGAALAAANGGALGTLRGRTAFERNPLPMVMVPTTAGSGSEVSQWTVLKDDIAHRKFSVGGPQNFPRMAILDPITLSTLPRSLAAMSAVDALTHAFEAYFTNLASPITDSLALEAIRRLMRCLRPSILENDDGARLENLVAASMANMACTNAGLGLCHSLASPLESEFNVPHPLAVGTLLLRVLPFNAAIAPERARNVALAIGLDAEDSGTTIAQRVVEELEKLYDDLGFPTRIERARIDISRLREMAMRAVTAIARGKSPDGPITDETPIICPNVRAGTVADGMRLYAATIH